MKNEMIAMLLAGGKGTRLESLTKRNAKPAVYFGGKYRIIDFPLSNCANSNIGIVGVLTQYESVQLNTYIGAGTKWGLDGNHSKAVLLSPRQKEAGSSWYNGTADAIMHNMDFMDENEPEYVLILSGDHIYKMDYAKMLQFHKKQQADVTIGVIEVPLEEADRFGIMSIDSKQQIVEFAEKPKQPKSNLASMGIYIFTYKMLRHYLIEESKFDRSEHDFGKHIIPAMLADNRRMMAYKFSGYWKDVGTLESLWQANMDLLTSDELDLFNEHQNWKIYSEDTASLPQYIGPEAVVQNSLINQGAIIEGQVFDSVLFHNVTIEKGAVVSQAVILPGSIIRSGATVKCAIIGNDVEIKPEDNAVGTSQQIILITEETNHA